MGKLDGKIAIVTGGSKGMGYGTALKLAQHGATVTIVSRSEDVLTAAEFLRKQGYEVNGYQGDVTNLEQIRKIYDEVANKHGTIHILVNCAGISGGMKYFITQDADVARDKTMETNFKGTWNSCKAAVPYMIRQKYGKIINFASVTGCLVVDPGMAAYASTKGAVMAFTKALASEYAQVNITVNAILPGVIDTPMMDQSIARANPTNYAEVKASLAAGIPMKRLGTIEEAGNVAAFLASDESSYITGIGLIFDGGSSLPETHGTGWALPTVEY